MKSHLWRVLERSASYFRNHGNQSKVVSWNSVKQKCNKSISDYESTYKKAENSASEIKGLKIGWRTFVFGGESSIQLVESCNIATLSARMTVAFNDYVFTQQEVRAILYYTARLYRLLL